MEVLISGGKRFRGLKKSSALFINFGASFPTDELDTFDREGIEFVHSSDTTQGLASIHHHDVDVVVIKLPKPTGKWLVSLQKIKQFQPNASIIVCQSESSSETIFGEDVFEILPLPVDFRFLLRAIKNAIERSRLISENNRLERVARARSSRSPQDSFSSDGSDSDFSSTTPRLVGQSEAMQEIGRMVEDVASSDMTVLLRGETGTGKDVVARCIHHLSSQDPSRPFIKICCPAIPELLLESELFGHEQGAFTGANIQKPGRLELAAGGTVFLDEIGEMPPTVQSKLLEVLEHRQFTRLGGHDPIKINTRIIAATNAPLENMLESGQFRQDLYFRINQFTIHMPSLQERVEDIPLLIDFFLRKYRSLYSREGLSLTPETIANFVQRPWPGNVRELESEIRRYALTGRGENTTPQTPKRTHVEASRAAGGIYHKSEKMVIMSALTAVKWNRRQAAEDLGISYSTLRRRIDRYGLNDLEFKIARSAEKTEPFQFKEAAFQVTDPAKTMPIELL